MERSPRHPRRGGMLSLGVLVVGILIVITFVESRRNLDLKRQLTNLESAYRDLESRHTKAKKETEQARAILAQLKSGQGDDNLPVISQVESFELTDQSNEPFTLKDLAGKIWLMDIIFTRCPGPCPMMTRSLANLQKEIPADWPVHFVTLTTDPEYDTPAVMSAYASRFKADSGRWTFLSGEKGVIERLAIKNLKMVAMQKKESKRVSPADLFIHAERFMLVDAKGRLRASFEHNDSALKLKVLEAISKLRTEMEDDE